MHSPFEFLKTRKNEQRGIWSNNSLFMENHITFYRIPKSKYIFYDLKEIKYKNIYYLNILDRFTILTQG